MDALAQPTFGSRLAGHRRLCNLTQAEVAEKAGMTTRYLSKLEHDGGCPTWDAVVRLSRALNVSLDYLAFGVVTQVAHTVPQWSWTTHVLWSQGGTTFRSEDT